MTQADNPSARKRPIKPAVALWLTFIAGFVDVAGAITIYDIFSAHMTGTTVRLGEHLVQRQWNAAAVAGTVLGAFVVGSLLGRVLIEAAARARFRSIAAITLGCEAALLVCALVIAPQQKIAAFSAVAPALVTLASAMGFQTATLTRVGPLTVHTTFVTGMINKLSQLVSHWIFRTYDLIRADAGHAEKLRSARRQIARESLFIFSIWLLYVLGAIAGAVCALRWHQKSFLVPFSMLVIAIAVDIFQPLSIEEEREQSER